MHVRNYWTSLFKKVSPPKPRRKVTPLFSWHQQSRTNSTSTRRARIWIRSGTTVSTWLRQCCELDGKQIRVPIRRTWLSTTTLPVSNRTLVLLQLLQIYSISLPEQRAQVLQIIQLLLPHHVQSILVAMLVRPQLHLLLQVQLVRLLLLLLLLLVLLLHKLRHNCLAIQHHQAFAMSLPCQPLETPQHLLEVSQPSQPTKLNQQPPHQRSISTGQSK